MQLRSGKVYDPEYPKKKTEFMRWSNPEFAVIWDECAKIYNEYMEGDFLNTKKAKEAGKRFKERLLQRVAEALKQTEI
jgi:hypothetical protein